MKKRCEQLGICQALNCQPCKLAREQKQAKRDEAQTELERRARCFDELLEACKRLVGSLGVVVMDADSCDDILHARAAIAKATGETL